LLPGLAGHGLQMRWKRQNASPRARAGGTGTRIGFGQITREAVSIRKYVNLKLIRFDAIIVTDDLRGSDERDPTCPATAQGAVVEVTRVTAPDAVALILPDGYILAEVS